MSQVPLLSLVTPDIGLRALPGLRGRSVSFHEPFADPFFFLFFSGFRVPLLLLVTQDVGSGALPGLRGRSVSFMNRLLTRSFFFLFMVSLFGWLHSRVTRSAPLCRSFTDSSFSLLFRAFYKVTR